MSNLSILDRNIVHAFGALDNAEEVERFYLDCRDKVGPLKAEAMAHEWGELHRFCSPLLRGHIKRLPHGIEGSGDAKDVLGFMEKRYFNWRKD